MGCGGRLRTQPRQDTDPRAGSAARERLCHSVAGSMPANAMAALLRGLVGLEGDLELLVLFLHRRSAGFRDTLLPRARHRNGVLNHEDRPVDLTVLIEAGSDFADLFEVKDAIEKRLP